MRKRRDDGFTLPEVLLSIVILGIIMSALSVAMITALRTRDEPAKKLGPSNDANLVSIYFGPDVQSAGQVSTDPAGSFDCATTPAGTKVVSLGWRTADGVDIVTGYFADASVLTRVQCVKGGALTGTNVVADNLGGCTPLPTCAAAAEIETSSGSSAVILTLLTLDAEAEPGDPAFPFSLRAVGRRISNDEGTPGGGGGSNNTLPPGEIRGTLTQHSDYAGSGAGTPLAAVPVYLRRNGVLLASSKTDASGRYFFGTLRDDATYQLEVVEDDLPPHVAPTDGQSLLTTVAVPAASPGPAIVDRNLKVWEPVGSVTGLVTVSIGGGPAVPVVNAVVNNVTTDDTATTDATGRYTFSFLNPGTYQIESAGNPPGTTVISANPCSAVVATSATPVSCPDFQYAQQSHPGSVGGTVTVQGSGTPLASWTVKLTLPGTPPTVWSTSTDAGGAYTFANVADGIYTVSIEPPAGYIPSNPATGSAGVTVAGGPISANFTAQQVCQLQDPHGDLGIELTGGGGLKGNERLAVRTDRACGAALTLDLAPSSPNGPTAAVSLSTTGAPTGVGTSHDYTSVKVTGGGSWSTGTATLTVREGSRVLGTLEVTIS